MINHFEDCGKLLECKNLSVLLVHPGEVINFFSFSNQVSLKLTTGFRVVEVILDFRYESGGEVFGIIFGVDCLFLIEVCKYEA